MAHRSTISGSRAQWFYLRGVGTSYLTVGDVLNEQGFDGTGGIRVSLSGAVEFQAEAGGTHFSTDSATVNASGTIRYKTSGGSALYATFSRSNVEESMLSTAGIRPSFGPFAGQLVGQVMDSRGVGGGLLRLTRRLAVSAEGGGGVRTGQNIDSNDFRRASAGAGLNIIAGPDESSLSLLRVCYGPEYFAFDENLFGFGGAVLTNSHGRVETRIRSESPQHVIRSRSAAEVRKGDEAVDRTGYRKPMPTDFSSER
jgi:hypothetical protein